MKPISRLIPIAACAALVIFAVPAHAARGFLIANAALRAGPDRDYPVIVRVPANARLDIQGCEEDWGWCDVAWGNYRGWVSGQYIQTFYHHRRAYIVESGPDVNVPIIAFNFGPYWDNYYRGRPFYRDRDRYAHLHDWDWQNHDRDNDRDHDRGHDRHDHDNDRWNR